MKALFNFRAPSNAQMMNPFQLPDDYPRIKEVGSFEELANGVFEDGVNAFCWRRPHVGDFAEMVGQLQVMEGITELDVPILEKMSLSCVGRAALDVLLDDLLCLQQLDRDPVVNLIDGYPRDEDPGPIATDVFSFHADSAPVEADTWLCTYHGASSEGLRNDEAVKKIEIAAIRAELLRIYGGADDEGFREFLADGCFDLHYAALAHAKPYSFGIGNLWRIAVEWPGSRVQPCIHRAPLTVSGDPVRLMMIC
jgi:hypothetical protein